MVLYGLLKTGEYLKDAEILSYAHEHLRFLEQIDEVGMLHQVLWNHESYAEASCTAMCAVVPVILSGRSIISMSFHGY